jgi:hypothetical protein
MQQQSKLDTVDVKNECAVCSTAYDGVKDEFGNEGGKHEDGNWYCVEHLGSAQECEDCRIWYRFHLGWGMNEINDRIICSTCFIKDPYRHIHFPEQHDAKRDALSMRFEAVFAEKRAEHFEKHAKRLTPIPPTPPISCADFVHLLNNAPSEHHIIQ